MLETEILPIPSLETKPSEYDSYQCSLSSKFKDIAKEELREDESVRTQALAQFREWIAKHPHIKKCRTDAPFLLRFLRTKKFSVPVACELLEKYLSVRQLFPQWFQKLDINDPAIEAIVDSGYLFPLPERDEHGRKIIFSCASRFDATKYTSAQMARTHAMIVESLLDDEESQVAGYCYITDEGGLTMNHISLWSLVDLKRMSKCIQVSSPMRHKETHFVNIPSIANKVIEFAMSLVSDKLRKRMFFDKNVDELKTRVNPDLLPTEYGGKVTMDEMIAKFKETLKKNRDKTLALDDMFIDLEGAPVNWLSNDDADIEAGIVGSFRKLEVD
ncbi:clavesin-1 [Chironomus tepperi]|uniref:clavesin-1 n=1 Tax=Chironomus tepperi TaxID=113505 RepID=UPI00391EE738